MSPEFHNHHKAHIHTDVIPATLITENKPNWLTGI